MQKIKYLVMDVDGTLTDGKIYIGSQGELFKAFNIKDGCGINYLTIPNGIEPIIITGRESEFVTNRCKEINIRLVFQNVKDKAAQLIKVVEDLSAVAYIGDDINDLECMRIVKAAGGIVGCPQDAAKDVISISDYVCSCNGGNGAVRDFIEYLVRK